MTPAERDQMRIRAFILLSAIAVMAVLGWLTRTNGWRLPYDSGYSVPALVFSCCGWIFERKATGE